MMRVKEPFFPWECHGKNLNSIRGVHFTPREIDIIACHINTRGTRKVASLLSISPNTVSSHIRSIKLKLGCNSREGIIDFIDVSPQLSLLKEHYTNLIVHTTFIKSLHVIGKERARRSSKHVHLILYGSDQSEEEIFQCYLEAHLKYADLPVNVEKTSNSIEERKDMIQQNTQGLVLYLDWNKEAQEKTPHKLFGFEVLRVSEHQNYYFLVIEILRKTLPNINVTQCFQNFLEQHQRKRPSFMGAETKIGFHPNQESEKMTDINLFFYVSLPYIIFIFVLFFILFFANSSYLINYKKSLPNNKIVIAELLVYLGTVHKDLGEHEKAKKLFNKGLRIYQEHFPEDHIEIARALAHLGDTLRATQQFQEAKALLEESLSSYRQHLPSEHIEVQWARDALKKVLQHLGEHRGAKPEAIMIKEKTKKGSNLQSPAK
jgi:DNA-binding CsgD family transcriptional regulator/tetratricopeptide (TPR) repeat protein